MLISSEPSDIFIDLLGFALDSAFHPDLRKPCEQVQIFDKADCLNQPRMSVDYLLHESSVGYAVFKVIHQADTVGNRLKEVQDSVQVLCCIGKITEVR